MRGVGPDGAVYPLLYGLLLAAAGRILAGRGDAKGKGENREPRPDRPRNHLHHGSYASEVRTRRLGRGWLGAEADGRRKGDARLRPRYREGEHNGSYRG